MTLREMYIIEFLKEYRVARTSALCHFFFFGKSSCYNVLRRMVNRGDIKKERFMDGLQHCEDIYYVNTLPSQLRHSLALTDFYYKWDVKHGVQNFEIQKKLGDIIPDGVMEYDNKIAIVEVELSKKGFNYLKYEGWCLSGEYKNYFNEMPEIIVYGNAKIPTSTVAKYRVVS